MIRLGFLSLIALVIIGCAQVTMPDMPLGKAKVDPNVTQYAATFTGSAGNQSNIAQSTIQSIQLHKRAQGVAPNPDIDKYLNGVLGRLQKSLPGTPAPARVYVTPSTEFSASSHQDGGIYITYKALDALESEDELAAIIAHEYAHVLLDHYQTNWIDSTANFAYKAGNIYINRQMKVSGSNDLLRMVVTNNAALEISQIGLIPALTREQEDAADQLGVDLLLRANYSFVGALNFLSRMQQWDEENERLLEARKVNYIDLFDKSEDSVIAKVIDDQINELENDASRFFRQASRHHDSGGDRSKNLRTYLKRHYANAARPPVSDSSYKVAIKSKKSSDFFEGLDLTHESVGALQKGNLHKALATAQQADKMVATNVAFTKHALISALALSGKSKEAVELLGQEVDSGNALYVDNMLMISALKGSNPEKALYLAQKSYDSYESPPELLPDLIALNKQQKNHLAMLKYYGLCGGQALSGASKELVDSCNRAKD